MERTCVVCHDRPAMFRCKQCHKPVCDDCAFKDENGAFCSRECSAGYRSFKQAEARAPTRRKGSPVRTLILLLVLLAIALAAAWKLDLLPESVTERIGGEGGAPTEPGPPPE